MNELKDYLDRRDYEGLHQLVDSDNHEENKSENQFKNESDAEGESEICGEN